MRTLTITRNKTFVGCASKLKVYIEDYEAPEMTILDTPCRQLGTLKNGETQSFEITEQAAKVFVIADKISKGYCNEFYPIPAGIDPVTLTGKCHYNPMSGNPFRFDGNSDASALANRRKNRNIGIIILIAAFAVGIVIGLFSSGLLSFASPETFERDGYSITLTNEFEQGASTDYGAVHVYESRDALVMISSEKFADYPGLSSYTLTAYGEALRQNGDTSTCSELYNADGLCYFDYTAEVDGDEYAYRTFAFKGKDAFWILTICTFADDFARAEADIMEWATSFRVE